MNINISCIGDIMYKLQDAYTAAKILGITFDKFRPEDLLLFFFF